MMPCDSGGRYWSDATASQGMPEQFLVRVGRQEKVGESTPLQPSEREWPFDNFYFRLPSS